MTTLLRKLKRLLTTAGPQPVISKRHLAKRYIAKQSIARRNIAKHDTAKRDTSTQQRSAVSGYLYHGRPVPSSDLRVNELTTTDHQQTDDSHCDHQADRIAVASSVQKDVDPNAVTADAASTTPTSAAPIDATTPMVKTTSPQSSSPDPSDATPIVDRVKLFLRSKQWHYTYYRPKTNDPLHSHHLSLHVRYRGLDCSYLFRIQESSTLLAIYGILPFTVPESHQSAAMLLITQINYDMIIGNLEMDISDGEIRFKNAIDVEHIDLNEAIIEPLLQSVVAMTTVAHEVFSDLLQVADPSDDIPTLLYEWREQVEARTFYLPTQYVQ